MEEYAKLRIKHKAIIVDHAIRIYGIKDLQASERAHLVKYLCDGGSLQSLLNSLKNGLQDFDVSSFGFQETQKADGIVTIIEPQLDFQVGKIKALTVNIENRSNWTWQSDKLTPIHLTYHWYAENGEIVCYDGVRTDLSDAIRPGAIRTMNVNVEAPNSSGNFLLEITLVKEGHFWFEHRGLNTRRELVRVDPPKLPRHVQKIYQDLLIAINRQPLEVN